ncbi:hypothetical protein BDEG_24639 [Batrachochytrium dendrobatidis JEL423]|uniref:Uncharacterized protein n=1 Tax=Batrachochytrium dendrobatidis (strain JEL423) TaxID=403673 RepID=A0A177WLH9_BATDL|nr:hypothetical protein BDEG_24639 [Batrachochytrium dendrobatidis JEL423]
MDLSLPGRIRQRPMDQPNSNIPSQTHRPTVIAAGSSTSKRGQKRPIDVIDLITFDQDQQPVDVAGPSTSKQSQQQSVSKGKSSNTVLNQVAGLKERYQKTFHRINQKLVESKEIRKKKQQEYRECSALRFEHELALVMGKDISGSKYSPEDEVKLKYEYEQAIRRVVTIKQDLKRFMKRHGLKFEELKLD